MELEKELISRMPWLALTFSGKPTNFKLRTLATISHLTRVTREERRMISVYIKNAWNTAESLRAQLNELVSEFVLSDTDKRRKNIYLRYNHALCNKINAALAYLLTLKQPLSLLTLPIVGHSMRLRKRCSVSFWSRMSAFCSTVEYLNYDPVTPTLHILLMT